MYQTEGHIEQQGFAVESISDLSVNAEGVSMDVPRGDQSGVNSSGDVGLTEPLLNAPVHTEHSSLSVSDTDVVHISDDAETTNVAAEIIPEISQPVSSEAPEEVQISEVAGESISDSSVNAKTVSIDVPLGDQSGVNSSENIGLTEPLLNAPVHTERSSLTVSDTDVAHISHDAETTNVAEEIIPEISQPVSSEAPEEVQISDGAGESISDLSVNAEGVSMDVPRGDQSGVNSSGDVGLTEPLLNAPVHTEHSSLSVSDTDVVHISDDAETTNVAAEIIPEISQPVSSEAPEEVQISEVAGESISDSSVNAKTVSIDVPLGDQSGVNSSEDVELTEPLLNAPVRSERSSLTVSDTDVAQISDDAEKANVAEEIIPEVSQPVSSDGPEEDQISDVEANKSFLSDLKEFEFVKKGFNRGPDVAIDEEDEQLRQYWTRALAMNRSNGEIVEEIVKVLKHHQNTHDLMCPVCGSCVTKRVILRKRKRTSQIYVDRWYQDPLDKEFEVLEQSIPLASQQTEGHENMEVEGNELLVEAYGCLACLSLFFEKGSNLLHLLQESTGRDCLPFLFPTYPWGNTNMKLASSVSQAVDVKAEGSSQSFCEGLSCSCGLIPALLPSYFWGSSRIAADGGEISQIPSNVDDDDGAEGQPRSADKVCTCGLVTALIPEHLWNIFYGNSSSPPGPEIDGIGVQEDTTGCAANVRHFLYEGANCMPRLVFAIFPIYPWGSTPIIADLETGSGTVRVSTTEVGDAESSHFSVSEGNSDYRIAAPDDNADDGHCASAVVPVVLPEYPWGTFIKERAIPEEFFTEIRAQDNIGESAKQNVELGSSSSEGTYNCIHGLAPSLLPAYPWGSPTGLARLSTYEIKHSYEGDASAVNVGEMDLKTAAAQRIEQHPHLTQSKDAGSKVAPNDSTDIGLERVASVLVPSYPWGIVSITTAGDYGWPQQSYETQKQSSTQSAAKLEEGSKYISMQANQSTIESEDADCMPGAIHIFPDYPWGRDFSTVDTLGHSESVQIKTHIQQETRIETSKKKVTDWQENVHVTTVLDATKSILEMQAEEQLSAASLHLKDEGTSFTSLEELKTQRYSGETSEMRTSLTLQEQSEITIFESTKLENQSSAQHSRLVTTPNVTELGGMKLDDQNDNQAIHIQSSSFQWSSQSIYSEEAKVKLPVEEKDSIKALPIGVTDHISLSDSDIKTPLLGSKDTADDIETGELILSQVDTASVPQGRRREVDPWDILKPIVYGGLDISIASLGVTSSAAGANAITRTVVYMGLATLFSGLVIFYHDVLNLYNYHIDYYKNVVGLTMLLHGTVALVSYVLFGALSPVIYGLSFRETDDRDDKFILCCGVTIVTVSLLSLGKAKVSDKRYIRALCAYLFTGVLSAIIGYLTGEHVAELLESWGI